MEDIKFHQCVIAKFENDRTISFIPPDEQFELMSYRLNTEVKLLIWIRWLVIGLSLDWTTIGQTIYWILIGLPDIGFLLDD